MTADQLLKSDGLLSTNGNLENANTQELDGGTLHRSLGAFDLTLLGIGASIGSGIFVLSGVALRDAGPGVVVSFAISAAVCMLDALCYAELASRFPMSGGPYLYSKMVFGRVPAAIVGMNLLFDYHIGAAAIARSFAGYLRNLISTGPEGSEGTHWIEGMPISGILSFNVIAPLLLAALTFVLCRGVSEGAMLNRALTGTKITTIAVVVIAGFSRCNFSLWTPLFPQGVAPVAAQSATLCFAYIGFDAIANSAEEVRKPSVDIPIAIVSALSICAVLYIAVVLALAGLVSYQDVDEEAPLASAFDSKKGMRWARVLVDVGGVVGLSTTLLVGLYAQARVYLGMARDGELPAFLAKVHAKYDSPLMAQLTCGLIAGVLATFFDVHMLASLLSIGVLTSYSAVSAATIILRTDNRPMTEKTLLCAVVLSGALSLSLRLGGAPVWVIVVLSFFLLLTLLPLRFMMEFPSPMNASNLFICPGMPFVPWCALCCNISLMVLLPVAAWIRLMIVSGFIFSYSKYKDGHQSMTREEEERRISSSILITHEEDIQNDSQNPLTGSGY